MRFLASTLLLATLVLTVCACGSERASDDHLRVEPLPGVYIMDVARTTKGRAKDADGHDVTIPKEAIDQVQAGNDADDFRLELNPDNTFHFVIPMGEKQWKTGGTWKELEAAVQLTTTTIDGEPAPPEMAITETYLIEDGRLVVEADGKRIYMMRVPDEVAPPKDD